MTFSVDEVFKILNFVVQGSLAAYIVRRYVVGQIVQYMGQEKYEIATLRQQYTLWREKHADIAVKMKEEQEVFLVMQEKFAIWDKQVKMVAAQEKSLCLERQKKTDESVARKLETIQRRQLIQAEFPEIIAQVTQGLQQSFKDDKVVGQKYISKVLDGLQG